MKTEYALRALFELSKASGDTLSRADIAERQEIPPPFLEQILIQLKNSGLISSRRGPGGGFELARPGEEITLWDIYRAVEQQNGFEGEKCFPAMKSECGRISVCKIKNVWFKVNETLRNTMLSMNLKNLQET